MKKKISWVFAIAFLLGPFFSGCGIFHPAIKDSDGYYTAHFNCCGPISIEKAINRYYHNQGIVFVRNPAPRKEVSKIIQDNGQAFKSFLALLDRDAVCSTWSWEIKAAVKKYGFTLVNADDFEKLDPSKDIAFVLVRGKFLSKAWHWMCYPVDTNIKTFFGSDTKIDKILLLKKIN
jgi:hypothetical protein